MGSKEQDFLLDLAIKHHTSGSHPGIYSVGMLTWADWEKLGTK